MQEKQVPIQRMGNSAVKGKPGIAIELPDRSALALSHLLLDFTGTLARDGILIPGVAPRIRKLH